MSVEIQTVVLASKILKVSGGIYDFNQGSIYIIFLTNGAYPMQYNARFYLLLRKAAKNTAVPFQLDIETIDGDGKVLSSGKSTITGTFPSGFRFWALDSILPLPIPKAGDYSVLFRVLSGPDNHTFRYDIEAT